MPKLPAAPVPSALQAPPPRPGQENGKAGLGEDAKQAGITVIDWVDERTSLTGAARWLMRRGYRRWFWQQKNIWQLNGGSLSWVWWPD